MNKLDPYIQGQVDLIKNIQENLEKMLDSEKTQGVDLALDIINLLKDIRPVNKTDQ